MYIHAYEKEGETERAVYLPSSSSFAASFWWLFECQVINITSRNGNLDRMAERISRMETMLRQRGFLQDGQDSNPQNDNRKTEYKELNTEQINEDDGRDSVPSLCATGMDSTIRTGITVTGTMMEPPLASDKERTVGRVEMWLEGVPSGVLGMDADVAEEEADDTGFTNGFQVG